MQRRMERFRFYSERQIPTAEREADEIASSLKSGLFTPEAVKSKLGEQMGADFSGVRFHTDGTAAKRADNIGARAFTSGRDVYFDSDGFDPGVAAHELAHTAQQGAVESISTVTSAPAGNVQMKKKDAEKKPPTHRSGFGLLRKHRDALDQVLEAKEDIDAGGRSRWDKLAWHERARYRMYNPLAVMRSNTKSGQYDYHQRKQETQEVAKMKALMSSTDTKDKDAQAKLKGSGMASSLTDTDQVNTAPKMDKSLFDSTAPKGGGKMDKSLFDSTAPKGGGKYDDIKAKLMVSLAPKGGAAAQGNAPALPKGSGKYDDLKAIGKGAGIGLGGAALGAIGGGIVGGRIAADTIHSGKGLSLDPFQGGINSAVGVGQSAAGLITGGINTYKSFKNVGKYLNEEGDEAEATNSSIDTVKNAAGTISAGANLISSAVDFATPVVNVLGGTVPAGIVPGAGLVGGTFGAIAGGMQAAQGAHKIYSGGKARSGMTKGLKEMEKLGSSGDKELDENRGDIVSSFKMAHGHAKNEQVGGIFDVGSGSLKAAAGITGVAANVAAMSGAGAVAAPVLGGIGGALGGVATATDISKGLAMRKMKKNLRNRTINEAFEKQGETDLEKQIKDYRENEANMVDGQKPSYKHAKHMVMIRHGVFSGSRSEAYGNMADTRAGKLAEIVDTKGTTGEPTEEAKIVESGLKSLGLKQVEQKDKSGNTKMGFHIGAIARKLGGKESKKASRDNRENKHLGANILRKR
jgi:hypothetical protein